MNSPPLKALRSLFARKRSRPKSDGRDGVLPEEAMHRVLRRERARSDRNHHGFTLLIFESGDQHSMQELTSILRGRLRDTDEAGWLDRERIAVLLPETGYEGASVLADELGRMLEGIANQPRSLVCCYPTDAARFAEVFGKSQPNRDDDPPAPLGGGGSGDRRVDPAPLSGSETLESLFVRPLPIWKRVLDVVVSSILLLASAPLMALIAIAIKLDSPGPVLFRQVRAGRGEKPFIFLKFRSMVRDAEGLKASIRHLNEQEGPIFKMERDPRITGLGQVLRRSSLDELPQLWNVLKGDMTLVGPRPPTLDEVPNYEPWQRRRLEVQGGITGLWQVSGRSTVRWPHFVRLDLRYIEERSLWTDLKILVRTVPAVLSARGAK